MKNTFNIYYINNEKASEISMLFDNEIIEKITRIKNNDFSASGSGDFSTDGTSKIPVVGKYIPSLNLDGGVSFSRAKKVEDTVVSGYKTVENTVVGSYKKVEDKFVDSFLREDNETIEEAKKRIKKQDK